MNKIMEIIKNDKIEYLNNPDINRVSEFLGINVMPEHLNIATILIEKLALLSIENGRMTKSNVKHIFKYINAEIRNRPIRSIFKRNSLAANFIKTPQTEWHEFNEKLKVLAEEHYIHRTSGGFADITVFGFDYRLSVDREFTPAKIFRAMSLLGCALVESTHFNKQMTMQEVKNNKNIFTEDLEGINRRKITMYWDVVFDYFFPN